MSEKTKRKKSAAVSAAAAVTAAGVLVGSMFNTPAELVKSYDRITIPVSVSDTLISNDDDDGGDASFSEDKQRNVKSALRKKFLMLPVSHRTLLGVPVWLVGRMVMALLGAAWGYAIHPALGIAIRYICIAALILASVIVTVKAVCPDVPVNKILNKRNVFTVVICTALFGTAGTVMQIFCPEGVKAYEIFESLVILAALSIVTIKIAAVSKIKYKKFPV